MESSSRVRRMAAPSCSCFHLSIRFLMREPISRRDSWPRFTKSWPLPQTASHRGHRPCISASRACRQQRSLWVSHSKVDVVVSHSKVDIVYSHSTVDIVGQISHSKVWVSHSKVDTVVSHSRVDTIVSHSKVDTVVGHRVDILVSHRVGTVVSHSTVEIVVSHSRHCGQSQHCGHYG